MVPVTCLRPQSKVSFACDKGGWTSLIKPDLQERNLVWSQATAACETSKPIVLQCSGASSDALVTACGLSLLQKSEQQIPLTSCNSMPSPFWRPTVNLGKFTSWVTDISWAGKTNCSCKCSDWPMHRDSSCKEWSQLRLKRQIPISMLQAWVDLPPAFRLLGLRVWKQKAVCFAERCQKQCRIQLSTNNNTFLACTAAHWGEQAPSLPLQQSLDQTIPVYSGNVFRPRINCSFSMKGHTPDIGSLISFPISPICVLHFHWETFWIHWLGCHVYWHV